MEVLPVEVVEKMSMIEVTAYISKLKEGKIKWGTPYYKVLIKNKWVCENAL